MTRLVIVEDKEKTRKAFIRAVDRLPDWQVVGNHASGESALNCIASERPDVVILDIGLPGISGVDCLVRLKYEMPKVVFAMFTIFDDDANLFAALNLGASGYILKEEGLTGIIRALHLLKKGQAYMSPTIATKIIQSFWRDSIDIGDFKKLTDRQLQIARLISEGKTSVEIAGLINITEGSVRQHLNRIYTTMHINNRHVLAVKYLELIRKLGNKHR